MKERIDLNKKTILITGAAGFIGSNLSLRILEMMEGGQIIGVDSLTDYTPIEHKQYRLDKIKKAALSSSSKWSFEKVDIADSSQISAVFKSFKPSVVVNLAAQAGVRYSITNPSAYIRSNLDGFFNILECCRYDDALEHLVYASSSSVYGGRTEVPFRETDDVSNPVSLYAATKKSNELLAHSYAKLYDIPCTGLRFFTVYGPMGRTDMAYFSFAEKLRRGESIDIFNYGNCQRDFTFIDDIVLGIINVMSSAPTKTTGTDGLPIPPYDIYNIGNSHPERLMDFVHILAEELIAVGALDDDFDIESHINLVPMQPGDVPITYADTSKLETDYGFKPCTDIRTGLKRFAEWYCDYYCGQNDGITDGV